MEPLCSNVSTLLLGIAGIILLTAIAFVWDGKYLEMQLIKRWLGDIYVIKLFTNPVFSLLLWFIVAAICVLTFGAPGLLIAVVLYFAERKIFAPYILRQNLKKALAKGKYETEFKENDNLYNKAVVAPKIVQLKFLLEHPKVAVIIATINENLLSQAELFSIPIELNTTSNIPADVQALSYFKTFTSDTEEGRKQVEEELRKHNDKTEKKVSALKINHKTNKKKENRTQKSFDWKSLLVICVIFLILAVPAICFRVNNARVDSIISRYDGYLETADILANGCESLPTGLKDFAEEILELDTSNFDYNNLDFEQCKDMINHREYFTGLKDYIRQKALDKYNEETDSSVFYKIVNWAQCMTSGCPASKISSHYHL